jgi:hypothetical protein
MVSLNKSLARDSKSLLPSQGLNLLVKADYHWLCNRFNPTYGNVHYTPQRMIVRCETAIRFDRRLEYVVSMPKAAGHDPSYCSTAPEASASLQDSPKSDT